MAEDHDSVGHHTPTVRARETPREGEDDGPKGQKICKACLTTQPAGEFCVRCGGELMEIRAAEDLYIDQVVGGKYTLVEKIGQGGMGVVYKGINEKLGQRVAVKFLSRKLADDESIVMRFLNEARSYCRVVHPNAVTLLDYGQHEDGTLYIITEFIEGKSLTDTLKAVGPLAPDESMSVALQVCEVLSAAHKEGVIHRDLKPDNLMLIPSTRGRYAVKVLDFGIAKIVDEENGPTTETGSVFGTPEFMSPEQARGDAADPRSDLYALGIILFYTLTGKLPFRGKNKLVVLNKQLNADPPRPSEVREGIEVPPRLEAVILKLLNKDPAARYESADDLAEALEELHVPGGSSTAKVGIKVTSSDSSPEIRLHTLRFGDLAESTDAEEEESADPLGDTIAQFGHREFDETVAPADLESIEMWREHPTSETTGRDAEGQRFKIIAGIAVAAVVVLTAAVISLSGESETPTNGGVESVLATGQVLGMLAAAEEMVEDGDIEEARRSLDATELWLADEDLPDKGMERRRELRRRVEKLGTWQVQIEDALDKRACGDAAKTLKSIRDESPGLADRLKDRVVGCETGGEKPAVVEEPAVAPEPDAGAEVAVPTPPPEEPPAQQVAPKETTSSEPPTSVEKTLEQFEEEQAPKEKPAEEVPGGMALPPKNLEGSGEDAGS